MTVLLEVEDLVVHFRLARSAAAMLAGQPSRVVRAVNGISLTVRQGEALGIVGESGCGKSTLGRAVMGLTPATSGRVRLDGQDITTDQGRHVARLRRRAQMIFQDPHAALNPRLSVRKTLAEVLAVHRVCPPSEIEGRVARLLDRVGLGTAHADRRAGALSGGQCQRVGIARALALAPDLLIADECVSALDVSIQAQILNLLKDLQDRLGLTYLFISHNLAVVRHVSDRVGVMYLGRIVELADKATLFASPRHVRFVVDVAKTAQRLAAKARQAATT